MVELVAYYSLKQGVTELPRAEVSEALRSRLPAYMVPAYLEHLPIIPMTVANKADHKKLPAPEGPRRFTGRPPSSWRRAARPRRVLARRAGRGAQARAGVGRGQLLRGPGRAFAADGALLRQDPPAPGPVGRVDARHLPQSDHRQARRPSATRRSRSSTRPRRRRAACRSAFRRTSPTTAAARCSSCSICSLRPARPLGVHVGAANGPTRRPTTRASSTLRSLAASQPDRSPSSPPFRSSPSGC